MKKSQITFLLKVALNTYQVSCNGGKPFLLRGFDGKTGKAQKAGDAQKAQRAEKDEKLEMLEKL